MRRRLAFELRWAVVAFVLSAAAAFVPLLGLLGYESATVFCLFAMVSTPSIVFRRLRDGTVQLGRDGVGEGAARLFGRALVPLAVPPVVLLLNALRVPNCDIVVGVELYLLLPVASAAVLVAVCTPLALAFRRTRWRVLAYVAVTLASIVMGVAHLLSEPPIFAFHPTIGYFAGSIYDEALELPPGLVPFRLMSLAFVAAALAGLAIAARRVQARPWRGPALVFALSALVWGAVYAQRFELRIESTRAAIVEHLGGVARSAHFIIYYSLSSSYFAERIDAVVADHEFRYAQLREYFGVEPEGPLVSFLYADSAQKAFCMGAGRTLIAKPWLREMHLTYDEVGDEHLTHEMAHLFSAAFGSGPLRLAGGTFGLDMGLIEGAAESAEWGGRDLTPHGWSAALYALDLAPDLARIQGAAGFWTRYPRTVYTLMGSFSRWLITEYGPERYRAVYASGEWEAAYDRSLDDLVTAWRAYLDSLPLADADLELARYYFDRPTIFGKPCARSVAARAQEAWRLQGALRYEDAAECFADVVADDPDNLEYQLAYAATLRQSEDFDRALAIAEAVVEREGAGAVQVARARELLGDIAWTRGDRTDARARYAEVLEAPLPDDDRRRVLVKREAAGDPRAGRVVFDLFLASPPVPRDSATLELGAGTEASGSWLLPYLLGLRLFEARGFQGAVVYLDLALARLDPTAAAASRDLFAIQRMAWRRRGQALYFVGRIDEARRQFRQLAESADPRYDSRAAEGSDWVARCDWAERNHP